eukprot:CAMPEP_0113268418 /NCGR_PEP_ID=MMETSP0008_2-20120614/21160_1 /TAXON_ID=97485 /ORGANISM="Prymnesium parvum" /LENGTH=34 /DNA_ID=CAMNT_0000117573 /DNA_START=153 /DNA_END=254 /DNA_ORIENTATION=- /assembly_acc=CAM_ASM_000153
MAEARGGVGWGGMGGGVACGVEWRAGRAGGGGRN